MPFAGSAAASCISFVAVSMLSRSFGSFATRKNEPVELREWQTQLQRGRAVIHLLCTQETRDRATAFVRLCWRAGSPGEEHYDQTIAALRSFTDSLRKELGSD